MNQIRITIEFCAAKSMQLEATMELRDSPQLNALIHSAFYLVGK